MWRIILLASQFMSCNKTCFNFVIYLFWHSSKPLTCSILASNWLWIMAWPFREDGIHCRGQNSWWSDCKYNCYDLRANTLILYHIIVVANTYYIKDAFNIIDYILNNTTCIVILFIPYNKVRRRTMELEESYDEMKSYLQEVLKEQEVSQ